MSAFTSIMRVQTAGALLVLLAALPADAVRAQQVGTAAAVNPAAQVRGSGGARTIVIGQSIAHRERIQTTSVGSVQLLFLDKTSMTIGPNSDLAIDEYVYDPASNTGKLAATLTKGVMRFVGGQISHAGNAQVTTPTAVVGIRGGVGIFTTRSVFIGYGEGSVRSGSSSVTLGAGDYTQTQGGGVPPTNPGPPPANFLQTVLAALQSQAGQGGGARATSGQVNHARATATGSSTGTIAANLPTTANTAPPPTQTLSNVNQTVQTTNSQTVVERSETAEPQELFGFAGGLAGSRNDLGPLGPVMAALGVGFAHTNTQNRVDSASFFAERFADNSNQPDRFENGFFQFGPSRSTQTIDELATNASVLLPSTGSGGVPAATVNDEALSQFDGGLVEFRPGSALAAAASQAVGGVKFCDCEYTRWGLWVANTVRTGQSTNGGPVRDNVEMFWVAGRLPANASDMPLTGTATYVGHAVANIQNGGSSYISAAPFQNTVNFGTGTGNVSISNLDGTTYTGQVNFSSGSPLFVSVNNLSGNNAQRSAFLLGSFFQGRTTGPVGEMGGTLQITGGSNYNGAGIFAARRN